jgi:hypothetical protein
VFQAWQFLAAISAPNCTASTATSPCCAQIAMDVLVAVKNGLLATGRFLVSVPGRVSRWMSMPKVHTRSLPRLFWACNLSTTWCQGTDHCTGSWLHPSQMLVVVLMLTGGVAGEEEKDVGDCQA